MQEKEITIEPDKLYSMSEIVRMEVVPGVTSYSAVRNRMFDEAAKPKSERTIKILKTGEGRSSKYFITGASLLKFMKAQNV